LLFSAARLLAVYVAASYRVVRLHQ
jgi:hypothetical protein